MAYKPRTDNLPMVTIGPDSMAHEQYAGRWYFLDALQRKVPRFWLELRELQRRGEPKEIEKWMKHAGVVDAWFSEIIWDTMQFWHDLGPAVELESGNHWFCYRVVDERKFQTPWFAPTFTNPIPNSLTGSMESWDQFEGRIRAEFDTQLREFGRYWRSITGEDHPWLREHAEYTAMAFTGLSYPCIAAKIKQSDAHIRVAVARFSERIGLTLPPRPHRRP